MPTDLDGKPLEGKNGPPVEWPIHTALHGARADALAVAHLHTPYATLFAIAKREFRPVTLQGAIFSDGVPFYPEAQLITTPARGNKLLKVIGDKRAALLRGHGIVVVGQNLQEVLYTALVLEDDTKKTLQAVTLGEVGTISPEECRAFGAEIALERRAQRAWNYFCSLEARWDRQPNTGKMRAISVNRNFSVPMVQNVQAQLFYLPRDTGESWRGGLNDLNRWNDLNKKDE